MLKVLFVCPFFPWPLNSGGKIRTFNLIRTLSDKVEIHLRALREPGTGNAGERRLAAACADVELFDRARAGAMMRWSRPKLERWFHSPRMREALNQDLRDGDFDLVHLDELLLARTLPPQPGIPVVQHHHKLDTVLYDRLSGHKGVHRHFDLWKLRRLESESVRRTRWHVVCGEHDAQILRTRYGPLETCVVPSGFDPDYFRSGETPALRTPHRILFLGTLSYGPNVDAILRFVRILPRIAESRPDVAFDIVGGDAAREVNALHGQRVNVIGSVRDVRPYLEGAALLVVPLRIGGGTRLKIVEALAMGCPVVSTRVGAEGLDLADREHLRLVDDEEGLARACREVLADPAEAARMAERGRVRVGELYTWEVLAQGLLAFWERAVAEERSAVGRGSGGAGLP